VIISTRVSLLTLQQHYFCSPSKSLYSSGIVAYPTYLNPLSVKKSPKSKGKVTLCQRAPRLPLSLLIQSLAVSLADIVQKRVFMLYIYDMWYLKG